MCQIILLRFRKQACSCQAHSEGSFQFTVISGKGWHTHWYDILTNNSAFKQYFLMTFQTFLWFISHSHRTKKKGCLHVTRATLIMAGCVGISDHLCWDIPYMFINMFYILYIYVLYIHYKIYIYIYVCVFLYQWRETCSVWYVPSYTDWETGKDLSWLTKSSTGRPVVRISGMVGIPCQSNPTIVGYIDFIIIHQ